MGRASIHTLLPIDSWAKIMAIDPWSFNQFRYPAKKGGQCADVMYQYAWQKDHMGREEVAQAIADAEDMVAAHLMYYPAPKYIFNEPVTYPQNYDHRQTFGGRTTPYGNWKSVQLKWHHVVSGGVPNRTSLGNTTSIVLSDRDNDGIKETFTATVTNVAISDIADVNEIGLYFTETDRDLEPLQETWRIRPVTVTVSGDTATIIGHATLLVVPNLTLGVNAEALSAETASNYVTELECWRTYTDTTFTEADPYQGVAVWKYPEDCTENCNYTVKPLCLAPKQNEQGVVAPVFGEPCYWPYQWAPASLKVNYLAGLSLQNGQMQPEMARSVAYLAASLLASEKCGCDRSNRILAYWRERVITFEDSVNKAQAYSKDYNALPFPVTRGGLFAWQRVQERRNIGIVSL